jgi:hypothetical protein
MKPLNNVWLARAVLSLGSLILSLNYVIAAEARALSPAGTWKVTMIDPQTKNKMGSEETLKINLEAGKLTGTITHRSNVNGSVRVYESAIQEIKLQGTDISFTFSHPPHVGRGPDVACTYQGKLAGDAIKGKIEQDWSGHTFRRDWQARRIAE